MRESPADRVSEIDVAIDYRDDPREFESLLFVEEGAIVGVAVPVADARIWHDKPSRLLSGLRAWWSTSVGAFRRSVYFSGAVVSSGEVGALRVFGLIGGGSEQPLRAREVEVRTTHSPAVVSPAQTRVAPSLDRSG